MTAKQAYSLTAQKELLDEDGKDLHHVVLYSLYPLHVKYDGIVYD